ncbi:hypothetical protein PanWU01x14_105860 [Parasponia andersonii]|uniref:Uncharacterized protein n=1 Tax=Parasponia andersonii TaxID=3476 RepID=A0A2P5D122_PARAD|nr:hypothetical protein PanWU01x14_105860 [Parasponia andersonii]
MAAEVPCEVKQSSLFLRNSLARSGVDATIHTAEPRRRESKGPWRAARRWKERWRRALRRWKWPMIGKATGLGGRRLVWEMEGKIGPRRRRRSKANKSARSIIFTLALSFLDKNTCEKF